MTIYFYLSIFVSTLFVFIFLEKSKKKIDKNQIYIILALIFILISSFRWKVGGDWETYLFTYNRSNLNLITFNWSFIFEIINYFFSNLRTGIFGVNIFVSSIFFLALYRFGKYLKFDLIIILLVSFSVVYFNGIMGYVRQTLSLAFLILTIEFLLKNKKYYSLVFISLAIFTHSSAVILIPIYLNKYYRNLNIMLLMVFLTFVSIILTYDRFVVAINEFVLKGTMSKGALFRSLPLLISCLIYILLRNKLFLNEKNLRFINDYLCLISFLLVLLIYLSPLLSAIADRFAFYMVIFQLLVVGLVFKKIIKVSNKNYLHYGIFVSISYFIITFSWFIFGDYSIYWLNYNFMYFE